MNALAIKPDGIYLDATLGGGGHTSAIASRLSACGTVIGIDRDPQALAYARAHILNTAGATLLLEQGVFGDFDSVLKRHSIAGLNGVLFDLGISSHQIDDPSRGFSYLHDEAALDMRMNGLSGQNAADLLAVYSEPELTAVLREFGEINNAPRMARTIIRGRNRCALRTAGDLKKCLMAEYGPVLNYKMLAKLFQALRIVVNQELDQLRNALEKACQLLVRGGRLAVISYHSLEDRIVKQFIAAHAVDCVCPTADPVCRCGGSNAVLKRITKSALVATDAELVLNVRSRSARLRVAEKK